MGYLSHISFILISWICFVFCDYEYYEDYYSEDTPEVVRVAPLTNVVLAGTLARNLEIPAVGKYVQIQLGNHMDRNVTVQLTKVGEDNSEEEIVFSYNKGHITPSYHNDVFWYYSETSFQNGRDGVFCSKQFLAKDSCRFSVTEYRSLTGDTRELRLRIQFINLKAEDHGWYNIQAFQGDVQHKIDPPQFKIIVEGPPVFVDELEESLELECDKPVNLTCRASGRPEAEVAWQEIDAESNLTPIILDTYLTVSDGGSVLTINSNPPYPRRTFICAAKNRKGEIEQSVTVTSAVGCNVSVNKADTNNQHDLKKLSTGVQLGVNLDCNIPDSAGPYLVQWDKNNGEGSTYVTSWYEGLVNEFPRGCGSDFGMFSGVYGRTGCKAKQIPASKTRFLNVGLASISINWVKSSDEGTYMCTVYSLRNSQEASKTFFQLTVFAKPQIETQSESISHAVIGQPFSLSCGAAGKPPPHISWVQGDNMLQGNTGGLFEVETRDNNSTLRISTVTEDMLGEFTCIAKNKEGAASATFLLVDEKTIIVKTKPQSAMVRAGERTVFGCSGSSLSGEVGTTWYKGNSPVKEVAFLQDRLILGDDGSLEIVTTHPDDSGVYVCELSTVPGVVETITAELVVFELPAEVVYTPSQVHLALGQAGVIPCYIAPKFLFATWTKDGEVFDPFDEGAGCEVDKNGFLQFQTVRKEMEGNYTCMPYNAEGTAGPSGVMEVIVHEEEYKGEMFEPLSDTNLPMFLPNTSTIVTADIRQTVNLTCNAVGNPEPEILWYKGGKAVHADENIAVYRHDRAGLFNDGTRLLIKSLRMKDLGQYTCIARNGGKIRNEQIISIELEMLKTLENVMVKEINAIQGSPFSLKCPIEKAKHPKKGSESEYAVLWFLEGVVRPFYVYYSDATQYSALNDQKHLINKDESAAYLELSKPHMNADTSYTCQVNREEINSPKTLYFSQHRFKVTVEARPSIVSDPKQYFYVSLGESITLRCGIDGAPQPDIHWYKDGKAIQQTDNLVFYKNRTELSITAFQPDNSGNYTCSALNRLGSAHHTVWVSHQNYLIPVQEPKNLTVVEGDEASFWCQATSGAGVPEYRWMMGGRNVTEVEDWGNRLEVRNEGRELVITDVVEGDTGLVTCIAFNNETRIELEASLAIGTPARVTGSVDDIHAFLDEPVLLPCHISSDPPLEYVTWFKDSAPYTPPYTSVDLSNGSLVLASVQYSDSGEYSCLPHNILGNTGGVSQPFTLIVE